MSEKTDQPNEYKSAQTKQSWFVPKKNGIGIAPRSWQGWASLGAALLIEIGIFYVFKSLHPEWWAPKLHGYGTRAVAWQGWVVLLTPVLLYVIFVARLYFKQNKRD